MNLNGGGRIKTWDTKVKRCPPLAYDRIESYHQKLMPKSWLDFEKNGNVLGQKVTPIDRAGLYISRGKGCLSQLPTHERHTCHCGRG